MKRHEDMVIDMYVRDTIKTLGTPPVQIEPSKEFCGRVMQSVVRKERQRGLLRVCLLGLVIMLPFVIRTVWIFVRNDYFSIESWPFGRAIISIYQVILSPVAGYAILSIGAAGSAYIIWRGFHKVQREVSRIGMA